MSREQIYDDEVAPLLKQAADIATKHGMSFAAIVEFEPGQTGRTFSGAIDMENTGAAMLLGHYAIRAAGNLDSMVINLARIARTTGHSSVTLQKFGVPTTPTKE